MDEKVLFTDFWTKESKTTSKVIARIPEGSDYKPDPRSRTAQQIAWQIVCEEKMIIEALETGTAAWSPPPMPPTVKEIVDAYERLNADMPARWKAIPGERWTGTVHFFGRDRSASAMAWSFCSISSIIGARSARICARWDQRSRRSTDRAATNPEQPLTACS
jgi:hypothetical protein